MIDPFWLKSFLKAMVLPPAGPLLLAGLGLLLLGRHPRAGRALAAAGVILLAALSLSPVSYLLQRSLGVAAPLDLQQAQHAQAIVILGGGTRPEAPEYGGDTLGGLTLERVRYGARIARLTRLPVLVSGGSVSGGDPEAQLMQQALVEEFGIPVRWAEIDSRNTHENAVRSAAILRADGVRRVVLVGHSFDIPRARAEFLAQGIEVIPAPIAIPSFALDDVLDLVPSMGALQGSYYAIYELLGLAVQRVTSAFR